MLVIWRLTARQTKFFFPKRIQFPLSWNRKYIHFWKDLHAKQSRFLMNLTARLFRKNCLNWIRKYRGLNQIKATSALTNYSRRTILFWWSYRGTISTHWFVEAAEIWKLREWLISLMASGASATRDPTGGTYSTECTRKNSKLPLSSRRLHIYVLGSWPFLSWLLILWNDLYHPCGWALSPAD